jgi:branched-subunit amino acid transport protein
MTLWLTILFMAGVTYALRGSFLLLPERFTLPQAMRRALRYVPAAVLTAIWAPELFLQQGHIDLSLGNVRLLAGAVAVVAAWYFRLTYVTIAAGLLALHFFAALVR